MSGVKRVYAVLNESADSLDPKSRIKITNVQGSIKFKGISFNRGDKTILENVNLDILPGQKVAFVGASGSGKSTILSLLPRFNRANNGSIFIDGQDTKDINLVSLRQQLGYVSQEPELFSGTIHEDIGFAIPDQEIDLPDIIIAAEAANAYDFIKKLPHGLETSIGESGDNLSGGQKQRISIARAFVKNAPILILDEPTSALDRTSSAKIIAAILRLMEGKTVLMATHEISLLKVMDVVYVVEAGAVIKIPDQAQLESYIASLTKNQEVSSVFKFQ
jgi:ABC-type multidrug transport system fused ATPase/permease subunit